MFAIEYYVGSARGVWARGLRLYASLEQAEAISAADFATECRHYGGVFLRRVVPA